MYTFSMAGGTLIQNHLDEFNFSIIFDLESLDMKIEDEDKAKLMVVSLLTSYMHFKGILLYSNNDTLLFKNVKANLLSKEKLDFQLRVEKGEGLLVRGESFDRGNTSKSKFERHKSNKSCRYYRKSRHVICKYFKLKIRGGKKTTITTPPPFSAGPIFSGFREIHM